MNRREQWAQAVAACRLPGMTGEVRALLLYLAYQHADHRGFISVPRATLADVFGVVPARISERIERAKQLGLLDTVRRGRPGVTAVYQGMLPPTWLGPSPRTMRGPAGRTTETEQSTLKHGPAGRTKQTPQHGPSQPVPKGKRVEPAPFGEPQQAPPALRSSG